jgi:ketosteroid isomerase-like protein
MPISDQYNPSVLVGWLDGMRRGDLDAIAALLDPDVHWRGLPAGAVCRNRDEVLDMLGGVLAEKRPRASALELVAGDGAVMLGVRADELRAIGDVPLPGQLFNVFRLRAGRIVSVDDYAHRAQALRAAQVSEPNWA